LVVAKDYRPVDRDQAFLLPPDLRDWLPARHVVWLLLDVVAELDLSALHATRRLGGVGRQGYDPAMLLGLLLYGYCTGVRSSRAIERLCEVDVAFRVLCAQDTPDHTTIARFRSEHAERIAALFEQVLRLCGRAGLGRVGTVAVDGTKIAADASMAASRTEEGLRAEAARMIAEAEAVDAAEDDLFGAARGDEVPVEWAESRTRRARVRRALAELDADHPRPAAPGAGDEPDPDRSPAVRRAERRAARARRSHQDWIERIETRQRASEARRAEAHARGEFFSAPKPKPTSDYADARAAAERAAAADQRLREEREAAAASARAGQDARAARADEARARTRRNTTDPDSRIMPVTGGWVQGYNAQLAVTGDGLIVATDVVKSSVDVAQLVPMMNRVVAGAADLDRGRGHPEPVGVVLADAGYFSHANLTAPGPDRLIADVKGRHLHTQQASTEPPPTASPAEVNAHRLRTPDGKILYKRRGATVEPVFGTIKEQRRMRRFSRRGLAAVQAEWRFAAIAHNLLKLHQAQPAR
jgi:transposase